MWVDPAAWAAPCVHCSFDAALLVQGAQHGSYEAEGEGARPTLQRHPTLLQRLPGHRLVHAATLRLEPVKYDAGYAGVACFASRSLMLQCCAHLAGCSDGPELLTCLTWPHVRGCYTSTSHSQRMQCRHHHVLLLCRVAESEGGPYQPRRPDRSIRGHPDCSIGVVSNGHYCRRPARMVRRCCPQPDPSLLLSHLG